MTEKKSNIFPDGTPVDPWFSGEVKPVTGKFFNAADFGVVPGSPDVLQTEAIQRVIDLAASRGGGVVSFPAGNYLSGALFFRPGTALHLEEGAVLTGSSDIADFPLLQTRMEGESVKYFSAFINADHADGFSISGGGVIDGNGLSYWRHFWLRLEFNPGCTNMDEMRPRLLYVSNSDDVTISGVTLRNSPFWTCHFYKCRRLKLCGLKITAPHEPVPAPSSDGVDLDACSQVLIRDCFFSVNDDALALKGGKGPQADKLPENGGNSEVIIEDCNFGYCHSALTCGSETVHNRNIIFRNCHVDGALRLFYLKMRPDTPQLNEFILLCGLSGRCGQVMLITSWAQFRRSEELFMSCGSRIELQKMNFECSEICRMEGDNEYSLSDISLKQCVFSTKHDFPASSLHSAAFSFEDCRVNIKRQTDSE